MRTVLAGALLCLVPEAAGAALPPVVWAGTYLCGQGETALTLTVRPGADGTADALFHFAAAPSNPGVPDGCFAMTGTYNARHLRFRATDWLLRPPGYVTVDLDGAVARDGQGVSGRVDGPGCTVFLLRRVKRDPFPAACHGPIS